MISIIIATKDRPKHLRRCLFSILSSSFCKYEIIVLDQSTGNKSSAIIDLLKHKRLRYIKCNFVGKGKALNLGIQRSKGNILAFTDDDCIASSSWLQQINKYFRCHRNINGVFGNTLPYRPSSHKKLYCPATLQIDTPRIVTDRHVIHYLELGHGNNMCIKKNVFKSIGGVQKWIGVGSASKTTGGLESEFIYRMLAHKMVLHHNPTLIVYHNRWLTYEQYQNLQSGYISGVTAFIVYASIKYIDPFLLKNIFVQSIHFTGRLNNIWNNFKIHRTIPSIELFFLFRHTISLFKGVFIGIYYAIFYDG